MSIKNDETFGVKVPSDLKQKAQEIVKESGLTGKEWLEKALALMDISSIKDGMLEHKEDLNELELHTTRIYELVANMVKRSAYKKDAAVGEVLEKLESKEAQFIKLKEQFDLLTTTNEIITKENKDKNEELEKTQDLLEQHKKTEERNEELFEEYKEKIQTLSGLVAEYKKHQDENLVLTKEINELKDRNKSAIEELKGQIRDHQEEIEDLQENLEKTSKEHQTEIERLGERKDVENERAILSLTKEHQEALAKTNNEYTSKIKEFYEDREKLRASFEKSLEEVNKKHREQIDKLNKEKEHLQTKIEILQQEKKDPHANENEQIKGEE